MTYKQFQEELESIFLAYIFLKYPNNSDLDLWSRYLYVINRLHETVFGARLPNIDFLFQDLDYKTYSYVTHSHTLNKNGYLNDEYAQYVIKFIKNNLDIIFSLDYFRLLCSRYSRY